VEEACGGLACERRETAAAYCEQLTSSSSTCPARPRPRSASSSAASAVTSRPTPTSQRPLSRRRNSRFQSLGLRSRPRRPCGISRFVGRQPDLAHSNRIRGTWSQARGSGVVRLQDHALVRGTALRSGGRPPRVGICNGEARRLAEARGADETRPRPHRSLRHTRGGHRALSPERNHHSLHDAAVVCTGVSAERPAVLAWGVPFRIGGSRPSTATPPRCSVRQRR
jgi:hypothetical protein